MKTVARLVPVLCLLGALGLGDAGVAGSSPELEVLRPLPMGDPLSASFQVGEIHRYSVDFEGGEFLLVEVAQKGIDVVVVLVDAEGADQLTVDSLGGAFITERFGFVAETAGRFEVVVSPLEALRANRYTIQAHKSSAHSWDRRYAEASLNLSEARHCLKATDRANHDRARLLFQKAADGWRKQDEAFQQALAEAYLGRVWKKLERPDLEMRTYDRALRTLKKAVGDRQDSTDEVALETDLLLNVGRLLRQRGSPDKAHQAYARALRLARRLGDESNEASALSSQATMAKQEGEFDVALESLSRAAEAYRRLDRPAALLTVLLHMSQIRMQQGKKDDALDVALGALEVARGFGEVAWMTKVWRQLGQTRHRRGEFEEAREAFSNAIGLARSTPTSESLPEILGGLGQVDFDLGRWDEAEARYLEALDLYRQLKRPNDEHAVLARLGELALARGHTVLALTYVDPALSWFRRAGKQDSVSYVLVLRSRVRRADGELEAARADLEEALEIVETQLLRTRSPSARFAFLEVRQDSFEYYVDLLVELAEASGEPEEALYAIERHRFRLLRELLEESRAKIRQSAAPKFRKREAEYWEELKKLVARMAEAERQKKPAAEVEKLARLERKLALRRESRQVNMFAQNSAYASVIRPRPFDLDHVQREYLDSETALLVFSLGETRGHIFRVTRDRVDRYPLAPRAKIEAAARNFHRNLATSYRPAELISVENQARKLGRLLLSQVDDDSTEKRWVIVADGALHHVPFAALRSPVDGDWLIRKREITYLPSISILDFLRRGPASPLEWTVAAVADPVFEFDDERVHLDPKAPTYSPPPFWTPYQRLRYSRTEAETIVSLLPPHRQFLALNFDANREMVMEGRLSSFDVVHFATHGVVDTQRPELSGVVLSRVDEQGRPRPDGILRLYDIFNLDLPAELVVLSSCGSGLGQETRGEGILGLTRGFLYAGASRLLVSLWPIKDRATAELMEKFYHALLNGGESPSAALRTAQLSMLDTSSFSAPYAWAAFVHQGDWR